MRTDTPIVTRLADYRPSDYLAETIALDILLHPTSTRVTAETLFRANPEGHAGAPLMLDGDELTLRAVLLDGQALPPETVEATPQGLILHRPPARPFRLTVVTELDPDANTKLMGLYRSSGIYCTQCEADGFRRITYALDRPDVMSVYTTRIEAEAEEAPTLLGNGNLVEAGRVEGTGRHYAVWHDPFPKPGYLFAIVGGRLGRVGKSYVTSSGRQVEIAVHVEPGKEGRAEYALDALERSMRWDERVFGREYDLDVFNIVAVSDFNMGAMENKGLNIFNDKYVLASPDTATDADYANIEAVIAHEYFHNWTGNRITCRDWFQLCLKEGLTVFRDQEFSSDQRSRAVHRIGEVRTLRARQFSEDAGPLAHPVRPSQYREINNFYTATVYEKGAEIVRMLRTLLGEADFTAGMARYFETCDGTAATVEDFLSAFAAASGRDLSAFAKWYDQAGTPAVSAKAAYDEAARSFRLDLTQATPPTPGQEEKEPLVLPIALGLVSAAGGELPLACEEVRPDGVHVMAGESATLVFRDLDERPVPSLFRNFSAPVKLTLALSDEDMLVLLRHDRDPFNRWQAAQTVALRLLAARASRRAADPGPAALERLGEALDAALARDAESDPAFAAALIALPGEAEIAQEIGQEIDPDAVRAAFVEARRTVGRTLAPRLADIRRATEEAGPYSPDATGAGRRSLRNMALDLLAQADPETGREEARRQIAQATNMTDRLAGLAVLAQIPGPDREDAFRAFAERYAEEPLVLDKWLGLQAAIPESGTLERVRALMGHPAFAMSNPNRVRALIGSFVLANPTQFHRPDGAGYRFLAGQVLALNGSNPQVAARLLTAFSTWRRMEPGRRREAEAALAAIADAPGLSRDVADIVARSLAIA